MTGTCTRCARTGRLRRADLCSACYQQLWRAGRLPEPEPERVKPSREDVARTLFQWDIAPDHPQPHPLWDDPHSAQLRDLWLSAADAVLALLPGRTEAEVKAEALEEAADSLVVWGVLAANSLHVSSVRSWLQHRAAALLRGESHV